MDTLLTESQHHTSVRVEDCSLLGKETTPQARAPALQGEQYLSVVGGHINVVTLCPSKEEHSFWMGRDQGHLVVTVSFGVF